MRHRMLKPVFAAVLGISTLFAATMVRGGEGQRTFRSILKEPAAQTKKEKPTTRKPSKNRNSKRKSSTNSKTKTTTRKRTTVPKIDFSPFGKPGYGSRIGLKTKSGTLPKTGFDIEKYLKTRRKIHQTFKPTFNSKYKLPSFKVVDPKTAHKESVVLLGDPYGRTQGTGFVISRRYGLIVTNSHVADLYRKHGRMSAMINGTRKSFTVKRVWFHPGVRRYLRGEKSMVIRSERPSDGPTAPGCPDIAVLQVNVSRTSLPSEMTIATTTELAKLQEQEIRIYGYPMTDTQRWPKSGEIVRATFDQGTVRNSYNFQYSARANDAENQYVQHSIPTIGGYSGSPLFLANGHVVAVHNSTVTKYGRRMGHGIRIDCLWELARHHKLTNMIPVPLTAKLNVSRWLVQNPKAADYRKALKLVDDASDDIYRKQQYSKGVTKCIEALKIVKFSDAYRTRSNGYTNYQFDNRDRLSKATRFKYQKLAAEDARMAVKLAPSDKKVAATITFCLTLNNLGDLTGNTKLNSLALEQLDEIVKKVKNVSRFDRARIHSFRGISLANLNRVSEAAKEHSKAVEMFPKEPFFLENRAAFWRANGYPSRAAADDAKASELRKKQKK